MKWNTFQDEMEGFLSAVDQQLAKMGITDTHFQDDWQAIQSADREERDFCKAVAQLGAYPYALTPSEQQAVINASKHVPPSIQDAFYSASTMERVEAHATELSAWIEEIQHSVTKSDFLISLRASTGEIERYPKPYDEGYAFARRLRRQLGAKDNSFSTLDSLLASFELSGEESIFSHPSSFFYETIVALNQHSTPGFAVNSARESQKKFAVCRGLFEYLTTANGAPMLITKERTYRQKRNRAFAAELLAPSKLLRGHIDQHVVDWEGVEDLSSAFGVSTRLIEL